jgi:saccharopine dehydrogenase-like NADP-dependent oxidoreductase
MKERTLRYPGHAKQMKMLRDGGFFKTEEIEVAGQKVKPIDMTAKILIDGWKYEEGEADLIVMRVEGEGTLGDTEMLIRWDLLDYYDNEKGQSSMARTTGFPAASIGRMIVDGTINMPGVLPPETFGENEVVVRRLLLELEDRGVRYIRTMEPVS